MTNRLKKLKKSMNKKQVKKAIDLFLQDSNDWLPDYYDPEMEIVCLKLALDELKERYNSLDARYNSACEELF